MLPNAELVTADVSRKCVKAAQGRGQLNGVQVLVGDQAKPSTLKRWRRTLGADLDAIVDDGGHRNTEISAAFDALWPLVALGGVYIIEDMHVGRMPVFEDTKGTGVMIDKITAWMHQLLTPDGGPDKHRFPLPPDVGWVFCQAEACVIGKQRHAVGSRELPSRGFVVMACVVVTSFGLIGLALSGRRRRVRPGPRAAR